MWMISGRYVDECGWFVGDIWIISGWNVDDMWVISGWYVDDMWMISRWYLDDITHISSIYHPDDIIHISNIYCINLPLNLLQDCLSGTSIYQNLKNLLTLILMKTLIYSKMIELLKHCTYRNYCIQFLTYKFFWKIIKYY